ncbi:imm68 putative immunity domain-containing protein [Aneurinibacillus migulanus]|nr:imm68 putative immunity domain-containing protein [Aneurinibacillus migulanus]MED0894404.1 imm68 putative immunity domain-containing protein [Aneurinibacillus migulanus]
MMYIERWWGEYIGGTDDTYTLIDYFVSREFELDIPAEINVKNILRDFQLTNAWEIKDLRQTKDIYFINDNGHRHDIGCAINLLMDVTAIILECQKNGKVHLTDLDGGIMDKDAVISLKAEKEELALLKKMLGDFIHHPLSYDLAELCPEDDMSEIAKQCKEIMTELNM